MTELLNALLDCDEAHEQRRLNNFLHAPALPKLYAILRAVNRQSKDALQAIADKTAAELKVLENTYVR
jgi:hypothetical protein